MKNFLSLIILLLIISFSFNLYADDCGCEQETNQLTLNFIDEMLATNNIDTALEILNLIVQTYTNTIKILAQYKIGKILMDYKNEYQQSVEFFNLVVKTAENSICKSNQKILFYAKDSIKNIAYIYHWYLKDFNSAIQNYTKIFALTTNSAEIIESKYNIAWCYVELKEFQQAAEIFYNIGILSNDNFSPRSLYEAGNNYFLIKKIKEAKDSYLKLMTFYPKSSWAPAAQSHFELINLNYLEE